MLSKSFSLKKFNLSWWACVSCGCVTTAPSAQWLIRPCIHISFNSAIKDHIISHRVARVYKAIKRMFY